MDAPPRPAGKFLIALLAGLWLLLLPLTVVAAAGEPAASLQMAVLETAADTPLDDLLRGRVVPGFTPLLSSHMGVNPDIRNRVWLRLKLRLPAQGGPWQVRVDRRGVQTLRAYFPEAPDVAVEVLADPPGPAHGSRNFPDSFYVPLPSQWRGEKVVYLEVAGAGYLHLAPRVVSAAESAALDRRADSRFLAVYLLLLLGLATAGIRHYYQAGQQMIGEGVWASVLLLACLAFNGHVGVLPGGNLLLGIGPGLGFSLLVVAAGQSLWATRRYAGMDRHTPTMSMAFDYAGWVLLFSGVVLAYLPERYAGVMQSGLLLLWVLTALACIFGLAMDTRQTRWSAIFVWSGILLSIAAMILAYQQVLPLTPVVQLGFQILLGILVLVHILVPWVRALMQARLMKKRKPEPVATPEQKIAAAREQLLTGLNSALRAASDGDLEWIAFRRLLEGLKPVLPQAASAVIAMNYHSEDLLLVEPKEALERYSMLLKQRSNLLRNLSRSTAPQQIVIDFDGPEGPLEHVQLAVIPLPIEKPGWGALLVERVVENEYSERELDMCAEFASLATTAGEEAAYAMQERRAAEIDPDVGVYRHSVITPMLAKSFEAAALQRKPLSVLLLALDNFQKLAAAQRLPVMHVLADLVRDEADYGQTLGRNGEDELLLIAPGLQIGEARELAERLCSAARKHRVAEMPEASFNMSIGVAQLQPGERTPQLMMNRLANALGKAREYGGNQAQATDSAVL